MGVSDKIKAILALNGKKIIELADYFGMTRQSMSNKMLRSSWSAEDLEKVATFVDCDLFFEMRNGQRIYLFSKDDKERFGPLIPKTNEVTRMGDDEYMDAKGNVFSRSEIEINEALGGGYEHVSASLFDDPKGLKEEARKFRKLEKRIDQEKMAKVSRGEYPKNQWGTIEIPALSDADKPDNVSDEEWRRFMQWRSQGRPKG